MTRGPPKGSGEGALVSHRCHLQVLELINELLHPHSIGVLMESQFGFLFPEPNLQFQGQIFNILLRNLDKTSLQRNRLEFLLGGQRMEFSPRDFALITGMKFAGWYEPPKESETHTELFKGRQSISLQEIAGRFRVECMNFGGESINALRLACLLIVYGIFVTMGEPGNHVDLHFFHLVDDVGKFLKYPWGLISYNTLVKRTHRARDVLEKHQSKEKILSFDANSFVLALQVWAYEVIPVVGRNCAYKVPHRVHVFPRVRRWECEYSVKYDVLAKYFKTLDAASLTPMLAGDIEKDFLHSLGFKRTDTSKTDDKSSREATKVENGEEEQFHQMMKRIETLENNVHSLEAKLVLLEGSTSEEMKNCKRPLPQSFNKDNSPKKCKVQETTSVPICRRKGLRSQSLQAGEASSNGLYLTVKKEGKGKAPEIEVTVGSYSKEPNPSETVKLSAYDPNEKSLDPGVSKGFDAWRAAAKKDSSIGLKIPCWMVGDVDAKWFDSLWSRRGWLNTSHMNALMNLLMLQFKSEPELSDGVWTALETYCWDVLCGSNVAIVMERAGPYVTGEKPINNRIPWAVARDVYGIGHVAGNHWVSYKIALDERCITVFDSQSLSSNWQPVKHIFKNVVKNVEFLCDRLDVFKDRGLGNPKKWKVVLYKHPPQQHGHFDCGVLAIKYIECLVSGNSIGIIDPTRCGFFRRSYCAKLFQVSSVVRGKDIGL